MTRDVLLELLQKEPFRELTLTLSNNDRILIRHPSNADVGRNFVVVREDRSAVQRTITLHHVIEVQSENAPHVGDH